MSRQQKKTDRTNMGRGLLLVAIALHFFCCTWSTAYFDGGPKSLVGLENTVGIYAKHSRKQDLMLGLIVPAALICVGTFIVFED